MNGGGSFGRRWEYETEEQRHRRIALDLEDFSWTALPWQANAHLVRAQATAVMFSPIDTMLDNESDVLSFAKDVMFDIYRL